MPLGDKTTYGGGNWQLHFSSEQRNLSRFHSLLGLHTRKKPTGSYDDRLIAIKTGWITNFRPTLNYFMHWDKIKH